MKKAPKTAVFLLMTLLLCLCVGCGRQSGGDGSASGEEWVPVPYKTTDIFADPGFSVATEGSFEDETLQITLKGRGKDLKLTTPSLNGVGIEDEAPTVQAFSGLMGWDGFCETHHASGTSWSLRLYYALDAGEDGSPVCIGAGYGYRASDDFVDVDEDGVFELVCTCTSAMDNKTEALVYHRSEGAVWRASVDRSSLLTDDSSPTEVNNVISYGVSLFEPETTTFFFRWPDQEGEQTQVPLRYPDQFTDEAYSPDPNQQIW